MKILQIFQSIRNSEIMVFKSLFIFYVYFIKVNFAYFLNLIFQTNLHQIFFLVPVESVFSYTVTVLSLTKTLESQLNGTYTPMPRSILKISSIYN